MYEDVGVRIFFWVLAEHFMIVNFGYTWTLIDLYEWEDAQDD